MGLPSPLGKDLASQFKAVEACLTRMIVHSQNDVTLQHTSLAKAEPFPSSPLSKATECWVRGPRHSWTGGTALWGPDQSFNIEAA